MRVVLLTVLGAKEDYAETASAVLCKKISGLIHFEIKQVKAKSAGREDATFKREAETKRLMQELENSDEVWLLDEHGKLAKNSREFSAWLIRGLESSKKRLVIVIGGAYGVGEELKQKAHRVISLSTLTMNHHVAKIMALEQIYRALTIHKNVPYHND
jgi:23S rRNA (pseudouridine1915-N3)-methyltransferase